MPLLLSAAVETALRIGASAVVVGLSRMTDASHLGLLGTDGRYLDERRHNILLRGDRYGVAGDYPSPRNHRPGDS